MEAFQEWINPAYTLTLCVFFSILAIVLFIIELRKDRKPSDNVEEYSLVRYNGERITITLRENKGDLEFVQINRLQ